MSLLPRHFLPRRRWTAALLLGAAALAAAFGVHMALVKLPGLAKAETLRQNRPAPIRSERRLSLPLEGWAVFRMDGEAVRHVSGSLAGRFRLAGTFRVVQPDATIQKAVLNDLVKKDAPLIVAVGDKLDDGIQVRSIEHDRMELVQQDVVCVLTLDFSTTNGVADASAGSGAGTNDIFQGYPVMGKGQFGIQVADGHWLFERHKVLAYYNTVLEDADRLVALFDSLKPLYGEDRKIGGYILIPEGENEFFKEVGLQEGDVIRKVNSAPLMNRRVAESFIRDFGNNELSAAVLEIERAGEPVKLVYELR